MEGNNAAVKSVASRMDRKIISTAAMIGGPIAGAMSTTGGTIAGAMSATGIGSATFQDDGGVVDLHASFTRSPAPCTAL